MEAEVSEIAGNLLTLKTEYFNNYVENLDADTMLKVLAIIVHRYSI